MNDNDKQKDPIIQPDKISSQNITSLISYFLTVRGFLILLIAVFVLSIAYYFAIALPNHNRAMLDLEREKFRVSEEEKNRKERLAKNDADYKKNMLKNCINGVEDRYWRYVELNKERTDKNGAIFAKADVWDRAQKVKKEELEECHRQWDTK
jgi:hypothetical protein